MSKVRVLSSDDIAKVTHSNDIIKAVENAYKQKALKKGEDFPLIFHEFIPGIADMDIKSGALKDPNCFGMKVVSLHSDNPNKGLPLLMSTTMLFDSNTGELKGLLNFESLTGIRTAAAATIGAMLLARKDSKTLLVIGCGHLSKYIVEIMKKQFVDLAKIMVYDPIDFENAKKLEREMLENEIEVQAINDLKNACLESDIIITATPSRKPIVMADYVKEGTHISCLGADMSGKQELDSNLVAKSSLYFDDFKQSTNVGEFEIPYKAGVLKDKIFNEIGLVLIDEKNGRKDNNEITIFDSTGISLQDIMVAYVLIERANIENIGQEIIF
ncbi:alanine dehydrogenase [Bacilli bacterium PM5-9]|nr:alanine dehydrogenase [Bacilli bacterium PM5-9]